MRHLWDSHSNGSVGGAADGVGGGGGGGMGSGLHDSNPFGMAMPPTGGSGGDAVDHHGAADAWFQRDWDDGPSGGPLSSRVFAIGSEANSLMQSILVASSSSHQQDANKRNTVHF
jgi:hypothetical protein